MLKAGDIIELTAGSYRLRIPLGGSAYGIVWRAAREAMPDVALKFVNRTQMELAPPNLRQRWIESAENETTFLRSLAPWDERHIVRLFDSGVHDGLPVMVLELLGSDLGQHLATDRQLGRVPSLHQAMGWLGQLNQALAKVHQYGWSYLDLKPANVLLTASGGVKLADFGTSRLRSATAAGMYAGTASWQAPEQFFPAAGNVYATDARTDFFALGAMFYYLVSEGQILQFGSACSQAFREHGSAAASALRARHAGAIPSTLNDDEAEAFHAVVASQAGSAAADAALALLRALVAPTREARTQHAMQVSRLIEAVNCAITASGLASRYNGTCRVTANLARSRAAPSLSPLPQPAWSTACA